MEKSHHNPQVHQKSSQLGCQPPGMGWEQTPGGEHWLCAVGCCVLSGCLLAARGVGLGGRDGLPGNCFESVLNSQAAEKVILLLCNWLCIYSFCALGVEADTEQELV